MAKIGKNLKRLRLERGLSQVQLAKLAGVSQQLISQLENDDNTSTKALPAIALVLGVPVHKIDENFDLGELTTGGVRVPLLSWVSAGNLRDQAGVMPADIERWITVGDLPHGDWIALTVDGNSMNRVAPDGATILVNRIDDKLIDERFYVFSLEAGAATFKQFRRKPERLAPFSTNPDHFSLPVEGELYVFGRVRRVITDI